MQIIDSLKNLVTGLGTAKDTTTTLGYALNVKTHVELSAMHRGDWIARKAVDIIPNDMTREWRNWQAKASQIELIEAVEKSPLVNLQPKVNRAMQAGRLFGGALIYIGIRNADPSQPLDPKSVSKGDLAYLHVLTRHQVVSGPVVQDIASEGYGLPEYYEIMGTTRTVRIHPSRTVRFEGAPILDPQTVATDEWSDSILQVIYDAVRNAGSAQEHVAALIPEAKTDIVYIPGLAGYAATTEGQRKLTARFTYANTAKSLFNMLLLDGTGPGGKEVGGEQWEQKSINFSQLPELIQQYLQIAAAAADIPITRMLGESAKGLNASGDGDLSNYYDNIGARQQVELQPALNRLDEILIRSALGTRPKAIYYEWAPLWGMSEKEEAEVFKLKADAARTLAGSNSGPLIPIDALSDALVNTFTEDGSLPGLEAAIEMHGKLSEQDPDEEDLAAAATPTPKGDITDAEPRTLYVSRKLLNAAEFLKWAKSQGFETTVPADELHVTVAYSRTPIDWMKAGQAWDRDDGKITVSAGGARIVESLGDKGAVVLLFTSADLSWRHMSIREAGASWDYEDYQPHVTITYSGQGVNLDEVEPYRGKLEFGPEIFEEIDDDWTGKLTEA